MKIAYGVLFADDLAPYQFWSPSDLDIVWGEIRRFMTDELVARHDILSSRRNRLSRHFTLYRNTPRINRTFDLIPDVAGRMATTNYEHLDETEFRPTGAEVMYVHFHKLKGTMDTINFGLGDSPRSFSIDRRGMLA